MAGTIEHEWNGTVLTITSDSGTSSADLKGEKGDDGARGPQGAPGDCVATDTAALGGVPAAEYATKDYLNSVIENVNVDYAYNLLDNSNFINPINQRGNTTYSGAIYGIDRWVGMSRSYITITEEGIRLSNNTPSSGNCYWQQIIPTKLVEEGKNYTIAAEIDGKIYVNSGTTPNNISVSHGNGTIMLLYSTVSNSYVFRVVLNSGFEGSITVKWVGLYKQNYTVEDIPDYQPKGYAAELLECQRYYRTTYKTFGNTIGNLTREIINFPQPMRIAPTTTLLSHWYGTEGSGYTIQSTSSNYIDIQYSGWGNVLLAHSSDL